VLVVGAGLFTRTLLNLRAAPLGFRPDHVLLFRLDATASGYSGTRLLDFYEQVHGRIGALPGVTAVSFSRHGLVADGAMRDALVIPGAPKGQEQVGVHVHFVGPRYVDATGVPLVAGRDLRAQDRENGPAVALVNQALAAQLSGRGAVVGQRVRYGKELDLEIVGVTGDARFSSLRAPAPPTLYLPYRQHPQHRMTFAVRTAGDPTSLAVGVRRTLDEIDSRVPPFEMLTQEAQIDLAVRKERLFAYVVTGFAALALMLACLGIYGTLAYSVTRRTTEIGLRMALGATRWSVLRLVIRESLVPVLVGVACGLGVAFATSTVVESMLFGLTSRDAATMVAGTAALIATAVIAAWLPSRRAARVDPMAALRAE